ncbi:putative amine oxidase [Brazilian marseillevirus]|uniref:putative amine oxidase n=1 Tax=Brazilian marseillevirus TaxID=1813599 RepID=UPI000784D8AF|nr:putative amine oxidase [Brazilian marseillevirus]AMQ10612.1 putative amine oxidase [Brazilian marseillevirus]
MEEFDTLVVGAGIGGSFFTWRLNTQRADERILLIEKEQEVGGRLLSISLGNGDFAEMCGMRIFPEVDRHIAKLLQMLEKSSKIVPYNEPQNIAYIKKRHLLVSFVASKDRRSFLNAMYGEKQPQDISVSSQILNAEVSLAPESDTQEWLRMFQNKSLNDADYASSLVSKGVSPKTLEMFRDFSGYNFLLDYPVGTSTGIRENLSLSGKSQQHFVTDGFQSVVKDLVQRIGGNATVLTNTKLLGFEKTRRGYVCTLSVAQRTVRVIAKKLVLAVPPDSLSELGIDTRKYFWPWNAFKAFFTVSQHTWNLLSSNGQRKGRNVSDTPARQVWFYSPGVLLLYCDNQDAEFWRQKVAPVEFNHKFECSRKYPKLWNCFISLLAEIFSVTPGDLDVQDVLFKYTKNGAWFFRNGGYRSFAQPFGKDEDIYLLGSQFSTSNGWTEGAVTSAEEVLQLFGVSSIL